MLQLILGRAGSGKTTELYRRIGQVAEAGGLAILLVPEQFSFENERELYLRLGPELSSRVEVLGFGRLCDYVFHTPADPLRSPDCVRQRCELIRKNLEYLGK